MGRSAKESHRRLLATAEQQQGLFTAKQAGEAGYSDAARVYQVKCGNWIRKARGVYQLADYPNTERPDLVLWSLWSRGVDDVPQGDRVLERGRTITLDGPSIRRLHLGVDNPESEDQDQDRVSGINRTKFPEPTGPTPRGERGARTPAGDGVAG